MVNSFQIKLYIISFKRGFAKVLRMANLKVDFSLKRCLCGKVNFIIWKCEFKREAKAYDVLNFFIGVEEILDKSQKVNYIDEDNDKDSVIVAFI